MDAITRQGIFTTLLLVAGLLSGLAFNALWSGKSRWIVAKYGLAGVGTLLPGLIPGHPAPLLACSALLLGAVYAQHRAYRGQQ